MWQAVLLFFAAAPTVDYSRDIHPILAEHCFRCHGGDQRMGGLSLRGYPEVMQGGRSGAIVTPGKPADSMLLRRIKGDGVALMPPGGPALSATEIGKVEHWIEEGSRASLSAPPAKPRWTPELTLKEPLAPSGPGVPVDRFLNAYWQQHGVTPAEPVGDALFARRAYLDVWGLLPTPEQLTAFVQSRDPHKREKLVDQLLANSRNYSENWISFWNDLLRNDEGVNYANDRKSITPWLQKALEDNLPYNQMVSALLNPVGPGAPDGFLTGVNWRGDINASQTPVMQAAQNSAQVFLGVNLKCNSCHDSFISKWKLKDAYGLAAFFAEQPKLELVRCDIKTGVQTAPKFLYPALDLPEPPQSLADRRAAVARMFTAPENGRTPRTLVNRIWTKLIGRGMIEQVDDMDGEPWSPELLDWLSSDLVRNNYDVKHLVRTIMLSRAYQLPSVPRGEEKKEYVFAGPEIRRITAEEFADHLSALTGEWRVYLGPGAKLGVYSREWHMGSTLLTRSLGRPIRDQVYTERDSSATTLQMLELVNGETLSRLLHNGSLRMLGQRPPAPENLWDSGGLSSKVVPVKVDLTGVRELHLVVKDTGSYSPERVSPVWADAKLIGPNGEIPLSTLKPVSAAPINTQGGAVQMKDAKFESGIRTKVNSDLVYTLPAGVTALEGSVGLEQSSLDSDISPSVRFFVFKEKPDFDRLVKTAPELPVAAPLNALTRDQLIDRVFTYSLGRAASAQERRVAGEYLQARARDKNVPADGVSDLIWSVAMLPEFQLIF